ncbi:MAG TPA: Omp28 family outer membrane lipoprotein [Bacteroidia bacterium]|jgi:thiol-disulfide isomerase/thioredoxin|nr:Omp28 family outer membrane lipoprotein [Bacteroidia bacterium]
MKQILFILFISSLLGIYSCDYVSDPFENTEPVNDGELCPSDSFTPNAKAHRVVLVEDYTGHRCTACPKAAIAAAQLEQTFGDSVVIMAVHANFFAAVYAPDYPENFKTAAGDAYDKQFAFSSYPSGLINRKDYPTNLHIKSYGSWASEVSQLLKTPIEADLQLKSHYNSADSTLCISAWSKFLSTQNGTFKLCMFLTQDSIIAPQLDGTVRVPNYVHMHMLKDNITAIWGDTLSTIGSTPAAIIKKYKYKIKPDYKGVACKVKDCHIVAFIYDNATYRILQAQQLKLN